MSTTTLDLGHINLISNIDDKNARAHAIIKRYALEHALMDVGVGVVSLVPGAAIPAILAAIALQNKVIYRPMAEELAKVYMTEVDTYTSNLASIASVSTVALEFAQEFAIEFLGECAQELIMEAGMGAVATVVPVIGAFVAAGLDYLIAQMLTWRVGAMTSIYFQNGGNWIGDRKTTMHIAKELTGGLMVSMSDAARLGRQVLAKHKPTEERGRFDLNDIPRRVPQVKQAAVASLLPMIKGFAARLSREDVRASLVAMGFAGVVIDAALQAYYASR